MKKLLLAMALSLSAVSMSYAACMGPFCWDDSGFSIGGVQSDGSGQGVPSMTEAVLNATTPKGAGLLIYCSDCELANVCVSTGPTRGGYTVVNSTSTSSVTNLVVHCD